jgi:hypothetical protein
VIDFRISYPFLRLNSGYELRKRNYLGLDLQYQYYFHSSIGVAAHAGGWIVPLRQSDAKLYLLLFQALTGLGYRAFPTSWFDPTVYVLGGVGWMAKKPTDTATTIRTCYPMGARASLSLYRQTNRFQDPELALTLIGSSFYIFNSVEAMKRLYFDIGLALRGAF